jgi:hypothetical protein
VHEIWEIAYKKMDADAKKHVYTHSFSDFYYGKMKQSEKTVRKGDLFITHEKCTGKWAEDSKVNCNIATTYFELLCNAHGLGTAIMSYPAEVLNELVPEAREMLVIPKDHYTKLMVGFGYPEIPYALTYGRIVSIGVPFVSICGAYGSIIRADGKPKLGMVGLLIGCVLNIILDPIFIFVFQWGVAGAAAATVIGQVANALLFIVYV